MKKLKYWVADQLYVFANWLLDKTEDVHTVEEQELPAPIDDERTYITKGYDANK